MNATEKLVALLRRIIGDNRRVFANVIPQETRPLPDRAVVFIEVGETRVQSFAGSVLDNTIFRIQFRARDYDVCVKDSEAFISACSAENPPIQVTGTASEYDDKLRLHFREVTARVR